MRGVAGLELEILKAKAAGLRLVPTRADEPQGQAIIELRARGLLREASIERTAKGLLRISEITPMGLLVLRASLT